jgi:hypothetical protein
MGIYLLGRVYQVYEVNSEQQMRLAAQEDLKNRIQAAFWGSAANDPQAQAQIVSGWQDMQRHAEADLAEQNRQVLQQWTQIGQQMRRQQAEAEKRRRQEMENWGRWQQNTNAYQSRYMPSPLPTFPQIGNATQQLPGSVGVYSQPAR